MASFLFRLFNSREKQLPKEKKKMAWIDINPGDVFEAITSDRRPFIILPNRILLQNGDRLKVVAELKNEPKKTYVCRMDNGVKVPVPASYLAYDFNKL